MCRGTTLSFAVAAVLALQGCSSSKPTGEPKKVGPEMYNDKQKGKYAQDSVAEAGRAKRDEYATEMQKKLDEFDMKYKALEKRASEATGDAKKDLDEKLKVAKAKREEAAKKLDELKQAGFDGWDKMKAGLGSALDDFKKAIE